MPLDVIRTFAFCSAYDDHSESMRSDASIAVEVIDGMVLVRL
jgi:hypothetical protein